MTVRHFFQWLIASSSESGSDEDANDGNPQRQSLKASFLAKLSGPIIGYGEDYALFQYIYDLHMWTTLGSKKNAVAESILTHCHQHGRARDVVPSARARMLVCWGGTNGRRATGMAQQRVAGALTVCPGAQR